MQAQSDIYNRSGSAEASQSGYAVYNAMVNYRFNDNYSLQLNANNLFDKQFLTTCLARGDCYFGARRTVVGSVTYRF